MYLKQRFPWIVQDGLEESFKGWSQLLVQVVPCINGNVVLQNVDRILTSFKELCTCVPTEQIWIDTHISGHTFHSLDDHIRHTVSNTWRSRCEKKTAHDWTLIPCCTCITLSHSLHQFHVCLWETVHGVSPSEWVHWSPVLMRTLLRIWSTTYWWWAVRCPIDWSVDPKWLVLCTWNCV